MFHEVRDILEERLGRHNESYVRIMRDHTLSEQVRNDSIRTISGRIDELNEVLDLMKSIYERDE